MVTWGSHSWSPVDVAAVNQEGTKAWNGPPEVTYLSTPQPLRETHGALPLPGFNLRIGRPKGPRDPPAEWTRV